MVAVLLVTTMVAVLLVLLVTVLLVTIVAVLLVLDFGRDGLEICFINFSSYV